MANVCVIVLFALSVPLAFVGYHLRNVMIQSNCGHCDMDEGGEDISAFKEYAQRIRDWKDQKLPGWDLAVSGPGSKVDHIRPFIDFLPAWMADHNVTSVVDVSSGHWPSGWQQGVKWPAADYVGVDVTPENKEENDEFIKNHGAAKFGLKSARFETNDMRNSLPPADLLITKDTLIHLPNHAILKFMEENVRVCPPKFKHILFVHDRPPEWKFRWGAFPGIRRLVQNWDIKKFSAFHEIDVRVSPYLLDAETVFEYMTSSHADRAETNPKVVQYHVPEC